MALPTPNASFSFELTIPSSGKEVRFRPYLVKEEKMLLMAVESENPQAVLKALKEIIESCFEDVKASQLAIFDVEYMFLNLRAKSAGEQTEINYRCSECDAENPILIDFEAIEIEAQDESKLTIDLGGDMTIKMRYPTIRDAMKHPILLGQSDAKKTEILFTLIDILIDKIAIGDKIENFHENSKLERMTFVEALSMKQLDLLKSFIRDLPAAKVPIEFKCNECGHENQTEVKGVQDFFG